MVQPFPLIFGLIDGQIFAFPFRSRDCKLGWRLKATIEGKSRQIERIAGIHDTALWDFLGQFCLDYHTQCLNQNLCSRHDWILCYR